MAIPTIAPARVRTAKSPGSRPVRSATASARAWVVLADHVFLGREVAEEGARRDLGGLGDLLDRGGVVALRAEQPERVLPDGSTRPGLLALAQPRPWPGRPGGRGRGRMFRQRGHAPILSHPAADRH